MRREMTYEELDHRVLAKALKEDGGFDLVLTRRQGQRFLAQVRSWQIIRRPFAGWRNGVRFYWNVLATILRAVVTGIISPKLWEALGVCFSNDAECVATRLPDDRMKVTILRDTKP
jgi:hypothetical protein